MIKASLIALGFAGAMIAATPAPALAQGVYVGPHGVALTLVSPSYREHYRGPIMPMTAAVGAAGQSPSSEPEACARSDAAINSRRVRPAREPRSRPLLSS